MTTELVVREEWLDMAAGMLAASPRYRVLSRFEPVGRYQPIDPAVENIRLGLYVDIEATGKEADVAEPIEVGAVLFSYDPIAGEILEVRGGFEAFNQPSAPIPENITRITGITDEMVAGYRLDPLFLRTIAGGVEIVVAHNARYDRRIAERIDRGMSEIDWACSYRDVPWTDGFGTGCSKLSHILADACGQFYDAHRASADCRVGVHVLATARDASGRSAFSYLLDASRRSTVRLYAVGSPFARKEHCKARGYRWSDGADGKPKAWWTEVPLEREAEESMFIREVAFGRIQRREITARDRYSVREETDLPPQRDVADTFDPQSGRGL